MSSHSDPPPGSTSYLARFINRMASFWPISRDACSAAFRVRQWSGSRPSGHAEWLKLVPVDRHGTWAAFRRSAKECPCLLELWPVPGSGSMRWRPSADRVSRSRV